MRTNAISKRILSVMLALVLVLGMIPVFASAADTTTIYVQPNSNWLNDGARFAAYFFGNGETWVDCVDAGDGLYSVEVPAGYPSVIFCRMNPGTTANSWSNKWNQTKDLTVPTDNKVVYVVDGWDKGAGQWIEKGGELEEIEVVYYLRGDMNGWGVQHPMTKIGDGTYSVTISLAAGTYAYKAADEGWGANWGEGGANGGNLSITVDEDADVTFTLDITAGTLIHDYTPACEHIWGEGSVITAATCTEAGESSFTCTLCGVSKTEPVAALGHNFVDRICTVCGLEKPVLAFYMVGYINGADYGTEGDFENMGEYKFVDGTLKATFTADSYVFIKTEGNANWYMAEAYCQDTTCTFVEGGSEKMFVPGNQALVFTLVENADGSLTLSYAVDPDGCAHEWDEGVETAAPSCTEAGEITYTCGLCGDTKTESVDALGHDYTDGVCGTCGEAEPVVDYYLVGYINGADYGCNDDYENLGQYKFVDGALTATFESDSYVFLKTGDNAHWFLSEAYCSDTTCTFIEGASEKMFVPGGVEINFTLVVNEDGSLTLSYETAGEACQHESHDIDGICTSCGIAVGHSYADGICGICGAEEPVPEYYLAGSFNEWNPCNAEYKLMQLGEVYYIGISLTAGDYEFKITDGPWEGGNAWPTENYVLDVPADSENISIMFYPETGEIEVSGIEQPEVEPGTLVLGDNTVGLGSYTFTATEDGLLNVTATSVSVFNEETGEWDVINPNMAFGMMFTLSINDETNFMPENQVEVSTGDVVTIELTCRAENQCEIILNLSYVVEEPVVDYYLVGYINGADYGCNDDYENLGEYKFIDGTLVATFDIDSYVFIKTGDNAKWFLTEAYCTDIIGIFVEGGSEKMFVPGGVEITFSLSENPDGSLTMSYSTAEPGVGATVSGTITSFLTDDDVTIELIQDGVVAYSVVASGKSAAYSIVGVADGAYTMKISKANHVALEVEVVISGEDAVFDASIYPLGDANGDGKVNMKDWARMYEHINEVNALTGYAFTSADVNNDGKVNMKDWARLYEHVNEINPLW